MDSSWNTTDTVGLTQASDHCGDVPQFQRDGNIFTTILQWGELALRSNSVPDLSDRIVKRPGPIKTPKPLLNMHWLGSIISPTSQM
jgi:hypothetical protein